MDPIKTMVTVDNVTSYYGSETNLTAKLTDSKGNPLVNKEVSFKVNNGSAITASTDGNGVAIVPYTVSQTRAKYNIEVDFDGEDTYDACVGCGTLSTNPNTLMSVDDVTGNHGSQTFLKANISNINGTSLANKNIVFTVDGAVVGSAVTNSQGIAVLPYNITQGRGNYTIKAEFNGDELYDSSTGTATLRVNTITTKLTVNNITTNKGKTIQITAKLTDTNNQPLANQRINFKNNNNIIGSAVTNSQGIAVLPYINTQSKGNYTIKAEFNGDELYDSSTGTATLRVNTITTKLTVNNITTNKGKTIQITAKLTDTNNQPLANQRIKFKINNTVMGTVTTNSNGIAVLSYLVKLSKGQYNIVVQFAGDDFYSKIQGTALLKVTK